MRKSNTTLFAVDTSIYGSLKEEHQNIEQDPQKICDWMEENQLNINYNKNVFFWKSTLKKPKASMENQNFSIINTETMKYLNVSLDQKLSVADNIEELTKKLKRVTNCFQSIKKFCSRKTLVQNV